MDEVLEKLDEALGELTEAVVPWEGHFSSPDSVRTALLDAGFDGVHVETFDLTADLSIDEYVGDRALGAGGRLGCHALGEAGWREFLERAAWEFRRRFGDRVRYGRAVALAVGTVA